MNDNILFAEPFIEVSFDAENDWIRTDWIGFIDQDKLFKGCDMILQAILQTHSSRILNENTHLTGTWPEMAEWVRKNYLSKLIDNGCKQIAWVVSPLIEDQTSALEYLQFTELDIELFLFADVQTATGWLKEIREK
jgi:hypothetical protein